eukprot:m.306413 g.306413  ORF g.306413 m.306413 type:complete len:601 (+) comp41220_c0_seq1:257-2059(+)
MDSLIWDLTEAAKVDNVVPFERLFNAEPSERIRCLLKPPGPGNLNKSACSPLITACRYTATGTVRFLLTQFERDQSLLDLESTGTVPSYRQGKEVRGATPLWVASAGGFLEIVDLLLDLKAQVDHATTTRSTPIRGAAFYGHLKVIEHLLEAGADINICNIDGQSPLLVACAMGHLSVVQYLVEHGAARARDISGLTEILMAAIYGHRNIFDYLVALPDCKVEDQIDGLELLGATLVDNRDDYNTALQCWTDALALRIQHAIPLPEYPDHPAYMGATMPSNMDDMVMLAADHKRMALLALVVRERVIGRTHPFTSHFVRYRAAVYCDQHEYHPSVALLIRSLGLQHHSTTVPYSNFDTVSEVVSQAELLSDMVFDGFKPDIAPFLEWVLDDVDQCLDSSIDFSHMRRLCLSFLGVWLEMQPATDGDYLFDEDVPMRRTLVTRLMSLEAKMRCTMGERETALHLACDSKSTETGPYPPHRFPSVETADYLIRLGIHVNLLNTRRQSALHLLCQKHHSDVNLKLCKCLLSSGAYMHVRDQDGKTALDYALESKDLDPVAQELQGQYMPRLKLSTLAARCIMEHKLDYKGVIPRRLESFVGLH